MSCSRFRVRTLGGSEMTASESESESESEPEDRVRSVSDPGGSESQPPPRKKKKNVLVSPLYHFTRPRQIKKTVVKNVEAFKK